MHYHKFEPTCVRLYHPQQFFSDSTSYKKSINIGKVNRNYSSKDCTAIKAQFENGENNEVLCGVDFTINNFEAVPVCYMKLQVTDEYGTRNSSEFMETILNHGNQNRYCFVVCILIENFLIWSTGN